MDSQTLDRIRFVTRHFNELRGLRYGVPLGLITLSLGGTTYFSNWPFLLLRGVFLLLAAVLIARSGAYYRRTFGEVEQQSVALGLPLDSLSIYSPIGGTARFPVSRGVPPLARWLLAATVLAFALLVTLRANSPSVLMAEDESLVQAPWHSLGAVLSVGKEPASAAVSVQDLMSTLRQQALYALYGSLLVGVWFWRGRRLSQGYYLAFGALLLGLSALGATLGRFVMGPWNQRIGQDVLTIFAPAVTHVWITLILCGTAMIVTGMLDHRQIVRVLDQPAARGVA